MNQELNQAAQQALEAFDAFSDADDFATLFELIRKMNVLRALTAAQPAQAGARGVVLPAGWVPLTIEHEPGFPEEVAFGPQRMMDRLKKWLDKHFAALAAQPAQAGEVDAKCQTCNGHGLVGGHMQDGSGYGEGCPDCNPEPAPLVKWASTQPAAQTDAPRTCPDACKSPEKCCNFGCQKPAQQATPEPGLLKTFLAEADRAGVTHLPATFATDLAAATPEPVGEPVEIVDLPRGHLVIGKLGDICSIRATDVRRGDILYTRPAPVVPEGFDINPGADGVLYVSNDRIGFTVLNDEEKSLAGRLLYSLAGAVLTAAQAKGGA